MKQGLLNRRPNMNQINRLNNREMLEDDDFDEPVAMSSFTKSKVDDDDDKFRNRSEPEFIDFMPTKKPEPSITPTRTDKSPSPFNTPPSSRDMPANKNKTPSTQQPNQNDKTPQKPSNTTPAKQPAKEQIQQKPVTPVKQDVTPAKQQPGTPNKEAKANFIDQPKNQQTKQAPVRPEDDNSRSVKTRNTPLISYEKNERIRAIEVRNQRDTTQDYVIKSHPHFYGPGDKYEDHEFPQNVSCLYQNPKSKVSSQITFERIENAYAAELVTVGDPKDITVGETKNYNFATVLAALTDNPILISRLIEDQKINKDGFYYVRLFVDGVWRYVIVDDFLPFENDKHLHIGPPIDQRLKKAKVQQKSELWSSIVEKAVSKVFGSYEDMNQNTYLNDQIKAGSIQDSLSILTGAPTSEFPLDPSVEAEFVKVLSQLNPQNLVIFSLKVQEGYSDNIRSKLCLQPEYGYTLLQFNKEKKELKLRNTWGWLKEPKQISVLKQITEDGQFNITLKDALQYFDTATISKFQSDYWTVSHSVRQADNSFSVFKVEFKEKTKFTLTFSQLDSRHFRNNLKEKYQYSFSRLQIFDGQTMIAQTYGATKEISVTTELNEGSYFAVICADWTFMALEGMLTYYGSSDIQICKVDFEPNLFAKLIGPYVTKNGEKRSIPPSNPSFNKQIVEQIWIGVDEKLLAISWTNVGQAQITYKRIIKNVQKKDKLTPIGFVNQSDADDSKKWTTNRINLIKNDSWLNGSEIEMTLQSNQSYVVLFKHNSDKTLLKELGL